MAIKQRERRKPEGDPNPYAPDPELDAIFDEIIALEAEQFGETPPPKPSKKTTEQSKKSSDPEIVIPNLREIAARKLRTGDIDQPTYERLIAKLDKMENGT